MVILRSGRVELIGGEMCILIDLPISCSLLTCKCQIFVLKPPLRIIPCDKSGRTSHKLYVPTPLPPFHVVQRKREGMHVIDQLLYKVCEG